MTLTTFQWHQRYLQQAQWTINLRTFLYSKIGLNPSKHLLDVGCGTGVLEKEFASQSSITAYGIDINFNNLQYAKDYAANTLYTCTDCLNLPYSDQAFDISLCHFVLLWISDPLKALTEMVRVTRSTGYVVALAEPDYGGRIDFPAELSQIGEWQSEALFAQGANPNMGRELRSLFHEAGLTEVEVGLLGGQWSDSTASQDNGMEWNVIESDLSENDSFQHQADQLKTIDREASNSGKRILFVPTFFAWGKVPPGA